MVFNLSEVHSIASQFLSEIRDVELQTDRAKFRRNIERIGELLAYEISKNLTFRTHSIQTPLANADVHRLVKSPVLITILRAGLPLMEGFQNYFDESDCGFIGAYRDEGFNTVEIKCDYMACPPIENQDVIIIDPMLATGNSIVKTLKGLLAKELPKKIHIACVIATPEGIENIMMYAKEISCSIKIWTGSIDQGLNEKFYIVPGLGDAGDLSFGNK